MHDVLQLGIDGFTDGSGEFAVDMVIEGNVSAEYASDDIRTHHIAVIGDCLGNHGQMERGNLCETLTERGLGNRNRFAVLELDAGIQRAEEGNFDRFAEHEALRCFGQCFTAGADTEIREVAVYRVVEAGLKTDLSIYLVVVVLD